MPAYVVPVAYRRAILEGQARCVWSFLQHSPVKHCHFMLPFQLPENVANISKCTRFNPIDHARAMHEFFFENLRNPARNRRAGLMRQFCPGQLDSINGNHAVC